jgi:hypothetical protein
MVIPIRGNTGLSSYFITSATAQRKAGGKPFQGFALLTHDGTRMPRPRVFCEGGNDAADTITNIL